MTTMDIRLSDPAQIARQEWLEPVGASALQLRERVICLDDAAHADEVFAQGSEPTGNPYGFNPIPAGGFTVTNALVDKLREELGI